MKVENNVTVFVGESTRSRRSQEMAEQQNDQKERKTLYAGDIKGVQDNILLRKQQARKKALKVVQDVWDGDRKIDDDLAARRERIKDLQKEIGDATKQLAAYKEEREDLRKTFGVEADSEEQKDLELLLKNREASRPGSRVSLTEEETERLKEISGQERTEYQSLILEMDESMDYYRDVVDGNKKEIEMENAIIQGVRLERLKKDPMLKAQQEADAIEEAAGKEILGMLIEEGKEHIDKEQVDREEQAGETKEEKEEQEELLAKRKEEREEAEKRAEDLAEDLPIQEMLVLDQVKQDIKKEISNIVDKMNLVVEDIKGSMVDKTL